MDIGGFETEIEYLIIAPFYSTRWCWVLAVLKPRSRIFDYGPVLQYIVVTLKQKLIFYLPFQQQIFQWLIVADSKLSSMTVPTRKTNVKNTKAGDFFCLDCFRKIKLQILPSNCSYQKNSYNLCFQDVCQNKA